MNRSVPVLRFAIVALMAAVAAVLAYLPNSPLPAQLHDFTAGLAVGMAVALLLMVVIFLIKPLRARLIPDCDDPQLKAINNRYLRQIAPAFVIYLLAIVGMRWAVGHGQPSWLQVLLVLLPLLAVALMVRAWLRYLRDADELQRRIELESLALAALIVSQLYFAGWFLIRAGMLHLDAADALLWMFTLMVFTRVGVRFWLQWKYS